MSTQLKWALLGLGGAGPKLADKGSVTAMDSSSTSLPVGASSITVDGVAIKDYMKVLYTNLSNSSLNNQVYVINGLESPSGATLTPEALSHGTMPGLGDALFVKEGASNMGAWAFAAGLWQAISVSIGA